MAFWRLYYHLVWTTKNREPLIPPQIEERLYGYIIRKAAEFGMYVYAINGIDDHTHVVGAIPPKLAVADAVKTLKGASAHYLNHELNLGYQFAWQRGYGALTVGEKQRAAALEYVLKQKEHHQQQTTNEWLERADEFDEGPPDTGLVVASVSVMQDERAVYDVLGGSPF